MTHHYIQDFLDGFKQAMPTAEGFGAFVGSLMVLIGIAAIVLSVVCVGVFVLQKMGMK